MAGGDEGLAAVSAGALARGGTGGTRGLPAAGSGGGSTGAEGGRGEGVAGIPGTTGAARRSGGGAAGADGAGGGSSCAGPVWWTTVFSGIGMEGAEPRPASGGRTGKGRGGVGGKSDTVSFAAGAGCFGSAADSADFVGGAAGAAAGLAAGLESCLDVKGSAAASPALFRSSPTWGEGSAAWPAPSPPDSRCRRAMATSSSIELEWVFFSPTPNSGSMSRITPGFTSSSLASSLMRIFFILPTPCARLSPSGARTIADGLTTSSRSTPPGLGPGILFFRGKT